MKNNSDNFHWSEFKRNHKVEALCFSLFHNHDLILGIFLTLLNKSALSYLFLKVT